MAHPYTEYRLYLCPLLTVKKSVLAEIVRAANVAETFRIGAPPKNITGPAATRYILHKVSSLTCATF